MAIDFDKIWASTSPLTPYSFTEANYKNGWNFIGATPPSRQMWDFLQKNNDEKAQYLFNNTAKYYNWQASTAYTVGNAVKTPTLPSECVLICTTAGTSDATEPDYTGVNIGDTVQDGTCEWLVSSYLPITGGTMKGAIILSVGDLFAKRDATDGYLELIGGTDETTGAHISLYGKDNASAGRINMEAADGVNSCYLRLYPDGQLTWGGKNVERVNSKSLVRASGYIRYEGGLQMCWGDTTVGTAGTAITYAQPFASSPRLLVSGATKSAGVGWSSNSSTGATLESSANSQTVAWLAVGDWL